MIYDNDFTQISIVFFNNHQFTPCWAVERANIYLFAGACKIHLGEYRSTWTVSLRVFRKG